jgi:LPS export ABC transporter ATP-binding protein
MAETLIRFVTSSRPDDRGVLETLRDLLAAADDDGRIAADTPWRRNGAADAIARLVEIDVVTPTGPDAIAGRPEADPAPVADVTAPNLRFSDRVLHESADDGGFASQRTRLLRMIDARIHELDPGGSGVRHEDLHSAGPAFVERLDVGWDALAGDGASGRGAGAGAGDAVVEEVAEGEFAGGTVAVDADDDSTLSARGLVKVYRKRRVVNEVDITLAQGEIVGLLGPNGAGKTTTFYMVVGLIKPDRGTVHFGDENVTAVPMYRRARRGIGYLAQEPSIFRKLTVEQNILAVLQMMRLPRREQRARLETLLDELGIKHLRHTKAYALSGGERRRLEITRALVGSPKFMLLDEPFAGVDPIAVHDIQQIVADLRRRGIGVLISDHNVEQTLDIVDRAYIMYEGRVRISGTVAELVWNDEAAEIYLGPTLTARMRQRYPQPQ